jgi:hypothetical protein
MGRPSKVYRPRDPAANALYHVVRDHFEALRAHAAHLRDGEGLPGFVEQEFREFLRCGWLAGGFARLRCTRCRIERLVAFSCKGRGFCPSCNSAQKADGTNTWKVGRVNTAAYRYLSSFGGFSL